MCFQPFDFFYFPLILCPARLLIHDLALGPGKRIHAWVTTWAKPLKKEVGKTANHYTQDPGGADSSPDWRGMIVCSSLIRNTIYTGCHSIVRWHMIIQESFVAGLITHARNPSTVESEARGSKVHKQPGMYTVRLCLKIKIADDWLIEIWCNNDVWGKPLSMFAFGQFLIILGGIDCLYYSIYNELHKRRNKVLVNNLPFCLDGVH